MRHCPCAHKQKRRHFHAKTTRANLYMYLGVRQGTCKKSRPYPARPYTTLVVLVCSQVLNACAHILSQERNLPRYAKPKLHFLLIQSPTQLSPPCSKRVILTLIHHWFSMYFHIFTLQSRILRKSISYKYTSQVLPLIGLSLCYQK